ETRERGRLNARLRRGRWCRRMRACRSCSGHDAVEGVRSTCCNDAANLSLGGAHGRLRLSQSCIDTGLSETHGHGGMRCPNNLRAATNDAQVLRFLATAQLGEHVVARDAG